MVYRCSYQFFVLFFLFFFAFKPVWSSGLATRNKKTGHSLTSGHIANQAPKKMSRQTRAEFSIWWTANDHFMASFAKTHLWKPVLFEIYLIPIYLYTYHILHNYVYIYLLEIEATELPSHGFSFFSKAPGVPFSKKNTFLRKGEKGFNWPSHWDFYERTL